MPDPVSGSVRLLRTVAGALASVLLPGECRLCAEPLTSASRVPICDTCLAAMPRMKPGVCEVCGRPLRGTGEAKEDQPNLCWQCNTSRYAFQRARSYGEYEGQLIRAILLLKFEKIEPLGNWFAGRLLEVVQSEPEGFQADLVVPVPLHRQRQKERGFNQVESFARPLARRLGLPYRPVLLMRTRPRPAKHLLGYEERWEAVRGAFAMQKGGRVDNLRVLLLDDVMTTGATLDACSRALHEAGASSVLGLTLARAVQPASPAGAFL